MSEVTFDEDNNSAAPIRNVVTSAAVRLPTNGILGWLFRRGWVKTPLQANILLVIVAVLCFGITVLLLARTMQAPEQSTEQRRMVEWMKVGGVGVPPQSFRPELR